MKFIHIADLHLGKRVNEFSMIEEQRHVLAQIREIAQNEDADALLIAGDIYDKSIASGEAIELFDWFLSEVHALNIKVFIISGNHDSAERTAFGQKLMQESNVFISPVYNGNISKYSFEDEYGVYNVFLLPFLKPANVKRFYPEEKIENYTDAIRIALKNCQIDPSTRNILLSHQFVAGGSICDSEIQIGGIDSVSADVYDKFDYVALGHLHGAQKIKRETMRYSGSILKYSFSEIKHKKSVCLVEMKEKGNIEIVLKELIPIHDMRKIEGTYNELTLKTNYENTHVDDYLRVVLRDEEDVIDALQRLRTIYPNIMKLEYQNARTRSLRNIEDLQTQTRKSEIELFSQFYEEQTGVQINEEQRKISEKVFKQCKEAHE